MPLYRYKAKMALFVHIPKTGGSTVEEVLKDAGAHQALKYHKRLGYSNSTPQHMQWDVLRHWIPKDFYSFAFAMVRHPVARIVSEYHWRTRISKRTLPAFDPWVNKHFDLFVEQPYILDNHIRPQAEFVGPPVRIFRLEDGLEPPIRAAFEHLQLGGGTPAIHHARKSEAETLEVTPATLARIKTFYAGDYETFGYDLEAPLPPGLVLTDTAAGARPA